MPMFEWFLIGIALAMIFSILFCPVTDHDNRYYRRRREHVTVVYTVPENLNRTSPRAQQTGVTIDPIFHAYPTNPTAPPPPPPPYTAAAPY
ncbi:unnamed protein product [Bursaphelenchus xylophilus]|uniref:(pine wood nematode) hypothetical protein n=1 Tax=Bursaphelenchus xylophilus TaxID=6326 RepID=A0A1I7RXR0_BURXY|nr:unnamed protein product [Bursaphelenchus xylophilus]CAG9126667.1 unnamed protein product [Bursaphelenchus xylophilus]